MTETRMFREIVTILHPDNNPYATTHEMDLLRRSIEAHQSGNIYEIKCIYTEITTRSTAVSVESWTNISLFDYLRNLGIEVIDKRSKGGCLWAVGTEREIGRTIREACRKYNVTGCFCGGGRATKYRPGWYTTCAC